VVQVRWTERAARDLQSIYSRVATDSEAAAARLFLGLLPATGRLRQFPHSGRVIPRFEGSGVREIIVRPYRIAYRVGGDEIRVLKVIHGARFLHFSDIEE
jgi:addiction module RelE/StbE family toxin